MLLKNIIADADLFVENNVPQEVKIRWINQIIQMLYRDYPIHDKTQVIKSIVGEQYYDLPTDCTEDRLRAVIYDGYSYDYIQEWKYSQLPDNYFTIESGQIKIYPPPDKVVDIGVYYMDKPVDLTIDDLETTPGYPEDYQEALVYGLAAKLADVSGTPDQSTYNTNKMNFIVAKAKEDVKRFRQTRVKTTRILM